MVGYSDLKERYQRLDSEVANIILIGCGAMIDVEAFLEIDPNEHVAVGESAANVSDLDRDLLAKSPHFNRKIYVFDGSRPWNLDNIFASEMVVCLDDGYIDLNLLNEKQSYKVLADASDAESETESASESEEESEIAEIETDDDEVTSSNADPESRKRRREEKEAMKMKKLRKREIRSAESKIETYYNQGTGMFTATSAIMYALLAKIGETSLENLWLAVLGLSSLDRIHPEVYDKILPLYRDEVYRLTPSKSGTEDKGADRTALAVEKDYHLFLLRHWTLYNSFFYLSMVNSKLNLWTEDGKNKLHKLFATMGISLSVAQQKWLYMDIAVKRNLPVIFTKYLPMYGLEGIVREGFVRTFGFTGQLSAMECVEALSALLEQDDLGGDVSEDDINARIERKENLWIQNFWLTWDALSTSHTNSSSVIVGASSRITSTRKLKGSDLLWHGLDLAKEKQQIIFRTGMSVLERHVIKNLRLYRLCVLNDGAIPDLAAFSNPLLLIKLGNWLLENISELEFFNLTLKSPDAKLNTLKPLVVASLDVASDTYLVVGLAPKYPREMDLSTKAKLAQQNEGSAAAFITRLNTFSVAFQKVAASSDAKVRINSFDSSIIEIRKDDLSPFLEKLTFSGLI